MFLGARLHDCITSCIQCQYEEYLLLACEHPTPSKQNFLQCHRQCSYLIISNAYYSTRSNFINPNNTKTYHVSSLQLHIQWPNRNIPFASGGNTAGKYDNVNDKTGLVACCFYSQNIVTECFNGPKKHLILEMCSQSTVCRSFAL